MPERQPYALAPGRAAELGLTGHIAPLPMEHRDSFELYALGDDVVVWLTRAEARALPRDVRDAQPGAHRRPSRDDAETLRRIVAYVESGRRPSRHREPGAEAWRDLAGRLPRAEELAGTFPDASGPNCFGTVMAAAGVPGAEKVWMQREPFEAWLAERTVPGGSDDEAGSVLVWRDDAGRVQHAAVTLGGGWAMHKPSQGWMSPTKVLTVREVKASARTPGRHRRRHRIV